VRIKISEHATLLATHEIFPRTGVHDKSYWKKINIRISAIIFLSISQTI